MLSLSIHEAFALPLDQDRLCRVLLYLFEDSIHRAAREGHIVLRVVASLEELTITLADDGEAIPADAQTWVFHGLYRSNREAPHDPTGSGLRLYVSRKIIKAHRGHMWMPKDSEHGAELQFILPLQDPPQNNSQD